MTDTVAFIPDVYKRQADFFADDIASGTQLIGGAEMAIVARDKLSDMLSEVDTLIPSLFRADVIATIVRDSLGNNRRGEFDPNHVAILDKLLFSGGEVSLFGLSIIVSPVVDELISRGSSTIKTTDMLAAVDVSIGLNPFDSSVDDTDKARNSRTIIGRLTLAQNVQKPSGAVDYNAVFLLADYHKETGQMVLGTNDQFIMHGDVDRGLPLFWQLLIHESDQTPLSQKGLDPSAETEGLVVYFEDGSKRAESFDSQSGVARILYETSGTQMPSETTLNSADPVLSVCAGYENSTDIPYLPKWMKDSEFADLPATLLLDVYNDKYVMTVRY